MPGADSLDADTANTLASFVGQGADYVSLINTSKFWHSLEQKAVEKTGKTLQQRTAERINKSALNKWMPYFRYYHNENGVLIVVNIKEILKISAPDSKAENTCLTVLTKLREMGENNSHLYLWKKKNENNLYILGCESYRDSKEIYNATLIANDIKFKVEREEKRACVTTIKDQPVEVPLVFQRANTLFEQLFFVELLEGYYPIVPYKPSTVPTHLFAAKQLGIENICVSEPSRNMTPRVQIKAHGVWQEVAVAPDRDGWYGWLNYPWATILNLSDNRYQAIRIAQNDGTVSLHLKDVAHPVSLTSIPVDKFDFSKVGLSFVATPIPLNFGCVGGVKKEQQRQSPYIRGVLGVAFFMGINACRFLKNSVSVPLLLSEASSSVSIFEFKP